MSRTIKQRRRSGRVTPKSTLKTSKDEIIQECLEPKQYWDDWVDYRDGMRDCRGDKTKLRSKNLLNTIRKYNEDDFEELNKNNDKLKKINKRKHLDGKKPI